jgi:hypothetical protein
MVDGAPEVVLHAVHPYEHLVEVPPPGDTERMALLGCC